MSAIGLLPWPPHQALAYLAGAGCVLAPFALGFTDSAALGVCVGAGVALLLIGLPGRGGPADHAAGAGPDVEDDELTNRG